MAKTELVECVRVNKVTGEVVQRMRMDKALLDRLIKRELEFPKLCEWKPADAATGHHPNPLTPPNPNPPKAAEPVPTGRKVPRLKDKEGDETPTAE